MITDPEKTSLLPTAPPVSSYSSDQNDIDPPVKGRLLVLLPVVLFYFFGISMQFYTLSEWIQYYVKTELFQNVSAMATQDSCLSSNHSSPGYLMYQQVQETTASWNIYKTLPATLCSLLVVTVLPSYTDSLGRRFLFIASYLGGLLSILLSAVAIYYRFSLWLIVASSVVDNLLGSYYSMNSASCAYISDITSSAKRRTFGFTIIDAGMLLMVTVSGLIAGFVIQTKGFFFAQVLSAIFMTTGFVILCFLPETHKQTNRSNVYNLYSNFKRTFSFYGSERFRDMRTAYLLLIAAYFFSEITTNQRTSIEMLYQLGMPFCWTNEMVGLFSSVRHAAQGFANMLLVAPLKLCLSEVTIATVSTMFNGASFILEGLATTDLMIYLVSVPALLGFLSVPMIKSVMSIITPSESQGSLFAGIGSVQALTGLINGFLLNYVYLATVSFFNGFIFLMLAGICGFGSFLLMYVQTIINRHCVMFRTPVAERFMRLNYNSSVLHNLCSSPSPGNTFI